MIFPWAQIYQEQEGEGADSTIPLSVLVAKHQLFGTHVTPVLVLSSALLSH